MTLHAVLCTVLLLGALGRAAADESSPFIQPKDQFLARVQRIALHPVRVSPNLDDGTPLRDRFDRLLADGLRARGYTVIDPATVLPVWRTMSEALGGVYDPLSGAHRAEPFTAACDHTGRELERLHEADAMLFATLGTDVAPFYSDGVYSSFKTWGEPLLWEGEPLGGGSPNRPQQVRAAFLQVLITDLACNVLYKTRVGIGWTTFYAARSREDRAPGQWHANPARVERAVALALDPLRRPD